MVIVLKLLLDTQMISKMLKNTRRICNVLINFLDMITEMINDKKLNPITTELFIEVEK